MASLKPPFQSQLYNILGFSWHWPVIPYIYYDLVKLYKTITGICIHVHTHCNCTTVYIYSVALRFNQEFARILIHLQC